MPASPQFRFVYSPADEALRGLSTPSLDCSRVQKAFASHCVPFHYGGPPGDVHTTAHAGCPLRFIPAASCSPNRHRPAKRKRPRIAGQKQAQHVTGQGRARLTSRIRQKRERSSVHSLAGAVLHPRRKDASQNGMKLRIARRSQGDQVMSAHKRPITPVSDIDQIQMPSNPYRPNGIHSLLRSIPLRSLPENVQGAAHYRMLLSAPFQQHPVHPLKAKPPCNVR